MQQAFGTSSTMLHTCITTYYTMSILTGPDQALGGPHAKICGVPIFRVDVDHESKLDYVRRYVKLYSLTHYVQS